MEVGENVGTNWKPLFDILMSVKIHDYKIDVLYLSDRQGFYDYMKTFMLQAILEFDKDAIHSLEYADCVDEEGFDTCTFVESLLPLEQSILINYMHLYLMSLYISEATIQTQMIGLRSEKNINADSDIKYKQQNVEALKENISAQLRDYLITIIIV